MLQRAGNPKTPKLDEVWSFWISVLAAPLASHTDNRARNPKTPKLERFWSFWISSLGRNFITIQLPAKSPPKVEPYDPTSPKGGGRLQENPNQPISVTMQTRREASTRRLAESEAPGERRGCVLTDRCPWSRSYKPCPDTGPKPPTPSFATEGRAERT